MNTNHRKAFFTQATKATLILFVSTVLILWAWNNSMTTIFGLPVIHFKEAISLIILGLGLSFVLRAGKHQLTHNRGYSNKEHNSNENHHEY